MNFMLMDYKGENVPTLNSTPGPPDCLGVGHPFNCVKDQLIEGIYKKI